MAIYQLADLVPHVPDSTWVADSAQVIGNMRLGEQCGVWYGAVIRGDSAAITLGDRSNVLENCVLHVDDDVPLTIGKGVTVVLPPHDRTRPMRSLTPARRRGPVVADDI